MELHLNRLDLVAIGDEIFLTVGSNKYHYIVDEVDIVDAVSNYVLYNREMTELH